MTAPVEAPGFLTDPGAEFLATGMVPLPEGDPDPDERRLLAEAAIALGAAFLVMRHQIAAHLAARRSPQPDEPAPMANAAWQRFLPLWLRLAVPAVKSAMAQRTPSLSAEELDQLALDFCLNLGSYLDTTSAEAVQLAFTHQLVDRQNDKLAWQRATNAYGLASREMVTYISGVMRGTPATTPGGIDPMQAALDRLLLRRADTVGENEIWRAMQSARTTAWALRYAAGRLPPGTQIEWDTREDEATCEQCAPMDHQRVEPGTPFTGPGESKVGCSPLHPGCRCEMNLIVPGPIEKYDPAEQRDWRGRWIADADDLAQEAAPGPAEPGLIPVRGGIPVPGGRRSGPIPAARPPVVQAPPEVPPVLVPPAELPLIPPAQVPQPSVKAPLTTPQDHGPKPKKAKKPQKAQRASATEPTPTGKLIPMPVRPAPAEAAPAATDPTSARASAGVVGAAPVEIKFWKANADLLDEVRDDARADAPSIIARRLSTADIDAIFALAELSPPSNYAVRRAVIARSIELGGGSNISEAYLDYVVYVKPQAAGDAGHVLAEETDAHGIDTSRVRPAQQITYESYAPGDSAGNVTGSYEVVGANYRSTEGAIPGIPGRRRVRLRPRISKSDKQPRDSHGRWTAFDALAPHERQAAALYHEQMIEDKMAAPGSTPRDYRYDVRDEPVRQFLARYMDADESFKRAYGPGEFEAHHQETLDQHPIPRYSAKRRWPIVVNDANPNYVDDGYHRLHSYMRDGATHIPVMRMQPKPISKQLSGFGVDHLPASVTGGPRDA